MSDRRTGNIWIVETTPPQMSLGLVMPWKFVDEAQPPKGTDLQVWNGEHVSIAKLKRGRFVAQVEGIDVLDPWEHPVVIKGVTHWDLPRPPK